MSIHPNINGSYREMNDGWVNINGVWRQIDSIHSNINGIWKEGYANKKPMWLYARFGGVFKGSYDNWETSFDITNPFGSNPIYQIAYSPVSKRWVMFEDGGSYRIATSENGMQWIVRPSIGRAVSKVRITSDGGFVVCINSTGVHRSIDGISWYKWYDFFFNATTSLSTGGGYIVFEKDTTAYAIGEHVTTPTADYSSFRRESNNISRISIKTFSNIVFFTTVGALNYYSSIWNNRSASTTSPSLSQLNDLEYNAYVGKYMVVGRYGLYSSTDGINFTSVTNFPLGPYGGNAIFYHNNVWLIVEPSGAIKKTINNGTSWTTAGQSLGTSSVTMSYGNY